MAVTAYTGHIPAIILLHRDLVCMCTCKCTLDVGSARATGSSLEGCCWACCYVPRGEHLPARKAVQGERSCVQTHRLHHRRLKSRPEALSSQAADPSTASGRPISLRVRAHVKNTRTKPNSEPSQASSRFCRRHSIWPPCNCNATWTSAIFLICSRGPALALQQRCLCAIARRYNALGAHLGFNLATFHDDDDSNIKRATSPP